METMEMDMSEMLITLTSDIVAAHLSNNNVDVDSVPTLITNVYAALSGLGNEAEKEEPRPDPAVAIRNSIKPDYIVCLEDGKKLKMLKRYLRTNYNLSPEEYRARWGLPADYPMVAPNYAETRRDLAKKIGLGRKPGAGRPRYLRYRWIVAWISSIARSISSSERPGSWWNVTRWRASARRANASAWSSALCPQPSWAGYSSSVYCASCRSRSAPRARSRASQRPP